MGVNKTTRQLFQEAYQAEIPDTRFSLYDLANAFYADENGSRLLSNNDEMRAFLMAQTGITGFQTMHDLWVNYLIQKGVTYRPSLTDMFQDFFAGVGFGAPIGQIGFLMLQAGTNNHILQENGSHLYID